MIEPDDGDLAEWEYQLDLDRMAELDPDETEEFLTDNERRVLEAIAQLSAEPPADGRVAD